MVWSEGSVASGKALEASTIATSISAVDKIPTTDRTRTSLVIRLRKRPMFLRLKSLRMSSAESAALVTELCNACEHRNPTKINDLIKEGAPLNNSSNDDRLPLFCVLKTGQYNLTKLLIDQGADVNKRHRSETALLCAVENRQAPFVNCWLKVERTSTLPIQKPMPSPQP